MIASLIREGSVMRYLLAACMSLIAMRADAGSASGTITQLYQRASDGLIIVYISGSASGRPACASATIYWMVRDENSSVGKGHFAMLMAAKVAGRTVSIQGNGTCLRWSDGEDISYVQITD